MRLLALVAWAVASLRDRRICALLFDIAAKRLAMGSVPQDRREGGILYTIYIYIGFIFFLLEAGIYIYMHMFYACICIWVLYFVLC